ncbi:MAG: gamma-glutamyltransferase, partial [Archangium sp.]|nr:gamma-glutamyltransferase [Archangium sp.]
MTRRIVIAVVACLAASPAFAIRPYASGAVASEHHLASEAGVEMLKAGGNAIDAAVSAAFMLAVVAPYHSGLGGGGFALVHMEGTATPRALDFREVAPAAASRDMYLRDGGVVPRASIDGALAVAVPAAVQGYLALHQAHGVLPRMKVLAPAIRVAKQGFVVTPWYRNFATMRESCLRSDGEASRLFLRPG